MKYLYLSPFSPMARHGAGAVIRNLFDEELESSVTWYSFCDTNTQYHKMKIFSAGVMMRVLHSFRFSRARSYVNHLLLPVERIYFGRKILKLMRKNNFHKVILYCHPNFFHIYKYIIENFDAQYHITIHDDPLNANKLRSNIGISDDKLLDDFKYILSACVTGDVISSAMSKAYREKYNRSFPVIQKGRPYFSERKKKLNIKNIRILKIFSAGNAWTTELSNLEHDSVIDFLRGIKLLISEGIDTCFHITTPYFPYESSFNFIKRHNYLSSAAYESLLESTHIGYAYDPLTEALREFAKYSFPSKLISYITNKIPFIYHGAYDSTVTELIAKYKCGIVIESRDPNNLKNAIKEIIEGYSGFQREADRAWRNNFNLLKVRNRYKQELQYTGEIECPY